ncbi:hypothetical protein JYU34_005364 [Plutella xylostella]|uniref:Uncharacterized protein n=1 Tax=Plutella xylostella TaxID=51655 RepID=A0ABQ7QWG9_PLUXY|nr:hypothetical protein JYU34_005364 [Plutella xylostella]
MESKKDPKILAPLQYVSGYFIKKSKKIYKTCKTCHDTLLAGEETEYIRYREYAGRRWLCSPSDSVVTLISNMQDVAMVLLKRNLEKNNLKQYISSVIYTLVDFNELSDGENHKEKLIQFLINAVCRFFIYNYCKLINRILYGKSDIDDLNDKYQIMAKTSFQKGLKK